MDLSDGGGLELGFVLRACLATCLMLLTACSSSAPCEEAGDSVVISASDYDQSCQTASDCVFVSAGNLCAPCALACTNAVISRRAEQQFLADRAALGVSKVNACRCPPQFLPQCRDGRCQTGM